MSSFSVNIYIIFLYDWCSSYMLFMVIVPWISLLYIITYNHWILISFILFFGFWDQVLCGLFLHWRRRCTSINLASMHGHIWFWLWCSHSHPLLLPISLKEFFGNSSLLKHPSCLPGALAHRCAHPFVHSQKEKIKRVSFW